MVDGVAREDIMLTNKELEARYAHDRVQLVNHYEGVFTPEEVAEAHQASREHLEKQATVLTFLPLLATRMATEMLVAKGQAEGRMTKALPEILFVSENNSCRSHMAAAITNHLAQGRVSVRCAGIHSQGGLSENVVTVLGERGITLTRPYPMPVTSSLVDAADVVVTMGAERFHEFPGKQWVNWDVPPIAGQGLPRVREVADDLERRVQALLQENSLVAA